MTDPKILDELVNEVVARLNPEALWEMSQGCRTVRIQQDAEQVRYIVECGAERVGCTALGEPLDQELAQYIDHTLLRASASRSDIEQLCREAAQYRFASVCINPYWVPLAHRLLCQTSVAVCTVVGFPLGANVTDTKVLETHRCIYDGAREIDMVINVGALKSGEDSLVQDDIGQVVQACHQKDAICKVIIEAAFLNDEEKVKACTLAKEVGADFVKTSTGFGPGGATASDVALMRRVVGPKLGVKAAGGIKDSLETRDMIRAGATRIGASAGIKIVQGEKAAAPSAGY